MIATVVRCPDCGSTNIEYIEEYGYWACNSCGQFLEFFKQEQKD